MGHSLTILSTNLSGRLSQWYFYAAIGVLFVVPVGLLAQSQTSFSADQQTMTVENAPDSDIISFGKTVVVKQSAKGVFTFGGDIIIEGRVEGDVGTIGGSIIQKKDAFVGGDVIVIGGSYKPEIPEPLRNEGKETIMIGIFEEEFRNLAQNPSQIFAPSFSLAFLAQRALSILFWFIVSLAVATIAPGAVSRAIARIHLSTLKVVAIGFLTLLVAMIAVIGSASILPNYLSAILGLMAFVLLMLAYVFGRVALHVSIGKLVQKRLLSDSNKSETLAIFIGVCIWTLLLSIPYVWTFALLALFSAGIGLVLTARSPSRWKTS